MPLRRMAARERTMLSAVAFHRAGFLLMLPVAGLLAVVTVLPIAADLGGGPVRSNA